MYVVVASWVGGGGAQLVKLGLFNTTLFSTLWHHHYQNEQKTLVQSSIRFMHSVLLTYEKNAFWDWKALNTYKINNTVVPCLT